MIVLGTAFGFVHVLDSLAARGVRLQLPAGSRALETGGYKGRSRSLPQAELHALMTQHLGIPAAHIICEYGMSELSSQAYDRVARQGRGEERGERDEGRGARRTGRGEGDGGIGHCFHFPPWARVRVVSPESGVEVGEGETGLLRVFDLANVYSVMAIQTEDIGVRRGDGFELVGRAARGEPRGCSLMEELRPQMS